MRKKVPGSPRRYSLPKGKFPSKISKKLSPWKIYHFKISQDTPNISGRSYPDRAFLEC